jgi:hypothetical protein
MEPINLSNTNQPQQLEVNCLGIERLVTTLAGILLVVDGLTRRSLAGMLLLFSGSYLVLRGISGEGFLFDLQKPSRYLRRSRRAIQSPKPRGNPSRPAIPQPGHLDSLAQLPV